MIDPVVGIPLIGNINSDTVTYLRRIFHHT